MINLSTNIDRGAASRLSGLFAYRRGPALWVVIALCALMLAPGVLTGIELCDSGFYLTFYENFFRAPGSVEYNFMYWLSGLFGGVTDAVAGDYAVLVHRVVGVGLLLSALVLTWQLEVQLVGRGALSLGLLMVVAAYSGYPLTMSFDIVSVFLIVAGASLLVRAVVKRKISCVIASGIVLGCMTFARIPNVLQFFLITVVPICMAGSSREKIRYCAGFICGYLGGTLLIIGIMELLGHLPVFIDNIATLRNLASDSEASHGIVNLIMAQFNYYASALYLMAKIAVLVFIAVLCQRFLSRNPLRGVIYIAEGLYVCYMLWSTSAVMVLTAICVPALLVVIINDRRSTIGIVALVALLSALIYPIGSDGAGNGGSIIYMLAIPVALNYYRNWNVDLRGKEMRIPTVAIIGFPAICIAIWLTVTLRGAFYFDDTPLWKMTTEANVSKLRGIRMSRQRAEIIEAGANMIGRHVQPGDTLMVYGSAPMINYLTSTRPYAGTSWPELESAAGISGRLHRSCESGSFPDICVQRFATIGYIWGKPSDSFVRGEDKATENVFHSNQKWRVISDFLKEHNYVKVDSTSHFDLWVRIR